MKHFDEEIRRLHETHWHTYPRTPKMNAHVERFNRTIQEEFIDYHQELLITPNEFNRQMIPWLIWYNAERPHWSLELKSPVQSLLNENPSLCKTWWPNTPGKVFLSWRHIPNCHFCNHRRGFRTQIGRSRSLSSVFNQCFLFGELVRMGVLLSRGKFYRPRPSGRWITLGNVLFLLNRARELRGLRSHSHAAS